MSGTTDAIQILINAKDEASSVFANVGKSAQGMKSALDGLVGKAATIAGGITAGAVAVKIFQQVAAGAGQTFENELTKKIDAAAAKAFALTDGIGQGFTIASKILPANSWLARLLDKGGALFGEGPRGLAGLAGAALRDIGASGNDHSGGGPLNEAGMVKGLGRDEALKVLRTKQKALLDEANSLTKGGEGMMSAADLVRNKQIGEQIASISKYIQNNLQVDPFQAIFKPGQFGGAKPVVPLDATAILKQQKEDRFTKEFGRPKGIIEGIAGEGRDGKAAADQQRNRLIEEGKRTIEAALTPQERFNKEVGDLQKQLKAGVLGEGPRGQEIFDRAQKAARDRLFEAIVPKDDKSPTKLADNEAIVKRFGGGVVPGKDLAQQQLDQLKAMNGRLKFFQDQALKEKEALQGREKERRVVLAAGIGFN